MKTAIGLALALFTVAAVAQSFGLQDQRSTPRGPDLQGGGYTRQTALVPPPEKRSAPEPPPASSGALYGNPAAYLKTVVGGSCAHAAQSNWISFRNEHPTARIRVIYDVKAGTVYPNIEFKKLEQYADNRVIAPGSIVEIACVLGDQGPAKGPDDGMVVIKEALFVR